MEGGTISWDSFDHSRHDAYNGHCSFVNWWYYSPHAPISNFFQYVIEKLTSSTKSSPHNAKFFCNTQTIKIKVVDSSNSKNEQIQLL